MKHYDVDPDKLSEVFKNTTSTYKYYWMLSLLDVVRYGHARKRISYTEMVARMISKAWLPITSGMFAFSKCDKLSARVHTLIFSTELKNCDTEDRVRQYLINHADDLAVKDIVDKLTHYVPYHFLYPWLGTIESKKKLSAESEKQAANRCPYSINYTDKSILINPVWIEYLTDHVDILEAFAKYHLTYYLMKYNDNIVLPDEEAMSVTADGASTSINRKMGFATEPLPQLSTAEEAEMLKKENRSLKHINKVLMELSKVKSVSNKYKFEAGTKNTIIAYPNKEQ